MKTRLLAGLLLVVAAAAVRSAEAPPPNRIQFVGIPVVRDTRTLPCWLAEYNGELYFLGVQGGVAAEFYPPQLDHRVLVEATLGTGPRICGGLPLTGLKISVLPEVEPGVGRMLPVEPGYDAPAATATRNITNLAAAPAGPPPSWARIRSENEAEIYFDFDQDFLPLHTTRVLETLAAQAKRINASRVEVAGLRGTTLLSDGQRLVEKSSLAAQRASKAAAILRGLGVANVVADSRTEPAPGDGINDPWNRRVTVRIIP